MQVWVNENGWLVKPYVNAEKPQSFLLYETSKTEHELFDSGKIFKVVDGELIDHTTTSNVSVAISSDLY